jgi:hypothetical protein
MTWTLIMHVYQAVGLRSVAMNLERIGLRISLAARDP